MKINLTSPFQVDWADPFSGVVSQKTITKLEVPYIHLDYRKEAVILQVTYQDDEGFDVSTNHSAFGANVVNPYLDGKDFTTLEGTGVNQTEVYSLLQSKYPFLAGSVS